ncbi:MAG: transposase, partial [Bacteroidota bacterium]
MHYIKPENRRQASLFSSLDDFVAADNPVRLLDLIIEEVVKANPEQFHRRGLSNIGRRAYSPQVLLKLYLYGYLHGISSSRKLEAETKRNMELMWLLGRLSPDHKTIADYRKDHGEAIRFMTLRFRAYLIDENYIAGKQVALDGTKVKANAARQKFMRTQSLEKRIESLEHQLERYLDQLKRNDVVDEAEDQDGGGDNLNQALIDKICELEDELREVKNDRDRLEASSLKKIHRTDPDCRNMRSAKGFEPAYNLQMITDMSFGFIAHAEIRQES